MPDSLDPSALFQAPPPSSLSSKANVAAVAAAQKAAKTSNAAPRVDLEPVYTSLKVTIIEYWAEYKDAIRLFVLGELNQDEFCLRTDHFLSGDPNVEHLHNQLIAGIIANSGRDLPEPGVAPFVSANDKPVVMSKPLTGDAAETRLKTEVMQLPPRDRRRLKDVPDPEVIDPIPASYTDYNHAKQFKGADAAATNTGAFSKTNLDLEIRKRYAQPLAGETGEFPDAETIQSRMVPICYEHSLPSGCAPACSNLVATATEHFIKEYLSSMFGRTRSNMPSGSINSVMTHRFRQQYNEEDDGFSRGTVFKDPGTGMLPIEATEASNRTGLAMHDMKFGVEAADVGLGHFPLVRAKITGGYEEGEYDTYQQLRKTNLKALKDGISSERKRAEKLRQYSTDGDVKMNGVGPSHGMNGVSGIPQHDEEDDEDYGWDGGNVNGRSSLTSALDECLAIGGV